MTDGLIDDIVSPEALFTKRRPLNRWSRAFQFPLIRMLVVIAYLVIPLGVRNLIVIFGVERLSPPGFYVALDLLEIVFFVALIIFYRFYTRHFEGREALEMSIPGALKEFSVGLGISAALVGSTFVLLLLTGSYQATGANTPWILPHAFLRFLIGAFLQVLVFRLILFRLAEEWLGTWIAFGLTAGLFSLAHVGNPNMTEAGMVGLLTGDVLLIAAFALTRRLWLVLGLHAGWNFFQDGVLGMPNSGITSLPSFLESEISGPEWMTGGVVGIEASTFTSIISFLVALWLLRLVVMRGQTVSPAWRGLRNDSA